MLLAFQRGGGKRSVRVVVRRNDNGVDFREQLLHVRGKLDGVILRELTPDGHIARGRSDEFHPLYGGKRRNVMSAHASRADNPYPNHLYVHCC